MKVTVWSLKILDRYHHQNIIERAFCPDCGATLFVECSGKKGSRKTAHTDRVQRFVTQNRVQLPTLFKEEWLRYEELRKMNRERLHERNEFRGLAEKIRRIKTSVQ